MSEFNFKSDFRYVSWKATLITAAYRSFACGITYGILMLIDSDPGIEPWVPFACPLLLPLAYFALFLPLGLLTSALSRAGVPYIGLVSIVCSLFIIPGDPLLFIFHQLTGKKYVPVRKFNVLNFALIIFVIDEEKRALAAVG